MADQDEAERLSNSEPNSRASQQAAEGGSQAQGSGASAGQEPAGRPQARQQVSAQQRQASSGQRAAQPVAAASRAAATKRPAAASGARATGEKRPSATRSAGAVRPASGGRPAAERRSGTARAASGQRQAAAATRGTAQGQRARQATGGAARQAPSAVSLEARREDLRRRGRLLGVARLRSVKGVMLIMATLTLIGQLLFLRPTHSNLENRDLAPFPQLSFQSVMSGAYYSDVSLWYSDTYPLREPMVAAAQALNRLHGFQPKTQMVGRTTGGDELPVPEEKKDSAKKGTEQAAAAAADNKELVQVPTQREMAEEIQSKIMEGLYVDNGAAYNIYYFDQESVELYARAMNTCAKNLEGKATVYSIVVPTSAGPMLDEKTIADLGGTDQKQAIKYFYSLYDESVHGIEVYDTLRAHNKEYIYYRTDHHWTELGAYYAYVEFCRDKGVEPSDILNRKKMTFDDFLGTFYVELGNPDMEAHPDYVDAYVPNSTNDMVVWDTDGNEIETNVITDVTDWNDNSKYNCFISGDRPLSRIDNPKKTDGSSCLVIKDSFGCAFVPLLVDDYQTTWVIDFRYSDRSIPDFVRENNIQDVIFLNAIVLAGTDPVATSLLAQSQNG